MDPPARLSASPILEHVVSNLMMSSDVQGRGKKQRETVTVQQPVCLGYIRAKTGNVVLANLSISGCRLWKDWQQEPHAWKVNLRD